MPSPRYCALCPPSDSRTSPQNCSRSDISSMHCSSQHGATQHSSPPHLLVHQDHLAHVLRVQRLAHGRAVADVAEHHLRRRGRKVSKEESKEVSEEASEEVSEEVSEGETHHDGTLLGAAG